MTRRLLDRIRRLTPAEIDWRVREAAHTAVDRLRARVSTPRWTQDGRAESIAASVLGRLRKEPARFVIDPLQSEAIREAALVRWPDAPSDAAARADRVIRGHYDLLGYRGLDVTQADGTIDWHFDPVHHRRAPVVCWANVPFLDPSSGDHKIIWELNRHQHWLQLGRALWLTRDRKYADAIVDQCENWLAANPPLTGINWASMLEIGFRCMSWTAALHFIAGSGQRTVGSTDHEVLTADCLLPTARFLTAIDLQLRHVERHLSYYFSPNTHLTGEALALYVVGSAFPELPASRRWIATGRRILIEEIDRQVLPDGGHAERSTHYQRYTLDFYLLALLTARRTGDADAERAFSAAASRLADFTRAMADDDGRLPLIGDDDGGMLWPLAGRECNDVRDSLAIAAVTLARPELAQWEVPEEAFWIASKEITEELATKTRRHGGTNFSQSTNPSPNLRVSVANVSVPSSQTFKDTGYAVLRDSSGAHAVFDVGAHGYMNGGHAHADALSLTLNVNGRPLLVDPGTSTYTMDPQLRDRIRSSLAHNTLSIDGQSQSTPAGPFHWRTRTNAQLHASRHNRGFDWVEGVHDGYAPLTHRRSIIRAADAGWLIVDTVSHSGALALESESRHAIATHWHFHPGWMIHAEGHALRATHLDGEEAWVISDDGHAVLRHGDEASGLGWFAPVYGTLLPAWSAQISHVCESPFATVTWIGSGHVGSRPTLRRLEVTGDAAHQVVAARVTSGEHASSYLIHVGEPSACDGRAGGVADYQTNARILHVRTRGEAIVAIDLADASHALSLRDDGISVTASEPIADLHLSLNDSVLTLAASEPPRQLRLEGRSVMGVRAVFLNGRSCPAPPIDAPDTLVVPRTAWGDPASARSGVPFAMDAVQLNGCEEISPLRESSW